MGQNNNNMPASVAAGTTGSLLKRVPTFFGKPFGSDRCFSNQVALPPVLQVSLLHHTWSKWKCRYRASAELRTSWIWSRCVGADKHPAKCAGQEATGPGCKKHLCFLENVRKLWKIRQHVTSCQILSLQDSKRRWNKKKTNLKSSQQSLWSYQQHLTY